MRPPIQGYIYASDEDPGLLAGAEAGDRAAMPDEKPPYIVVSHTLDDVIVGSKWPGTLWRAEVIEALNPQGHRGNYTRAISVMLLERAPIADLFGEHGSAIVKIVDAAHKINCVQVEQLAAARSDVADHLYSEAWKRWMSLRNKPAEGGFAGVISAGGISESPIGGGLSVVHGQVYKRAQAIGGPEAIEDDIEEDASWLAGEWSAAAGAVMDAALAYGAPDLFTGEAREVMTAPWAAVFGALD